MNCPYRCGKIAVRLAMPQDREKVLAFCQHTWDWGDYIPEAWDRWLSDPQGRLLVATLKEHPIALAHVTLASPSEAWFEGMRVAPRQRQKGIASLMVQECLKAARDLGVTVARFATSSGNVVVHHLAARLGFVRVGVFMAYAAEAGGQDDLPLETPLDPEEAWDLIQRSEPYLSGKGLFSTGWVFHQLTAEKLEARIRHEEVLGLRADRALRSLAFISTWATPREGLTADYIAGTAPEIGKMARALRAYSARRSLPQVTTRMTVAPGLQEVLTSAGYAPVTEDAFWIFEQPIP